MQPWDISTAGQGLRFAFSSTGPELEISSGTQKDTLSGLL